MKLKSLILMLACLMTVPAFAQTDFADEMDEANLMDELDPFDPNVERVLDLYDAEYESQTGESAFIDDAISLFHGAEAGQGCRRETCAVWARVSKAEQKLYLYVHGNLIATYATSTGTRGHGTPNFDTHPDGRIYNSYTSRRYPGGNYINDAGQKLGNMPYAVFIRGGFAIHGTGRGNWKLLGRPASHGCIRIHPDNAVIFNQLVRQYGVKNTWITVQ